MLDYFKKVLNSDENSEQTIGEFLYVCKFTIVDKEFKFEKSEPSKATVKIKINKKGEQEELKIYLERTNKCQIYQLTKEPIILENGDIEYEGFEKNHRALFIFFLDSKRKTFDMRIKELSNSGYLFLNIDIREFQNSNVINLAVQVEDKIGLITEIDIHFKNWVRNNGNNKFQVQMGTEIKEFTTLWQIFIEDEVPRFVTQFGCSKDFVRLAIKDYRLNFLTEVVKKL